MNDSETRTNEIEIKKMTKVNPEDHKKKKQIMRGIKGAGSLALSALSLVVLISKKK